MSSAIPLIVDALAVYRVTKLVIEDEITSDMRSKFLDKHDPETDKLGYLITCPWCVSFWVGAAAVAGRAVAPGLWDPFARVMAMSAATGILHHRVA